MDVKFDLNSAQQLISSMCNYCNSIQQDAVDVLKLIDSSPQWKDQQHQHFCDSVRLICSDLDKALRLESDYLKVYQERVKELRG